MNNLDLILGFLLLLIAAIFMLFRMLVPGKQTGSSFRVIPALESMRKAVYLSVEEGNRLHLSLGNSALVSPAFSSALVGFNAVEPMAQVSMLGDRPPVITSGDGGLAILSRDRLASVFRAGAAAQHDPLRSRLCGVTPTGYVLGAIPILRNEKVSTNILMGHFGAEVAVLGEVADRSESYMLGASDSPMAQAVMYATTKDVLIGEELYALPAYLQSGRAFVASVRTQDILRWILIVVMVGGAFARLILSLVGLQ
ncbi:MAG: hypothetical protein HPY45_02595 [Anaerolineae bacterium]|nr:hypothetical protein [Anaerolineae bacterium]